MNTLQPFEVIVPFAAWRRAVMPMLASPALVATGTLLRDPDRTPAGLLIDELTVSAAPRTGADFPPLADWIAVAVPRGDAALDPQTWIRLLQPRFAQMLAIALVGLGPQRQSWRGWTVERGVLHPLAGLRIVGPGMVHAASTQSQLEPMENDGARWSRLRGAVGESTQAKLHAAQVAVIGCSRTGSLAAGMLAALGVRGLILIDGDSIETHNLDGMLLNTEADLGVNKAIALGRRLVEFRSDILVKAVPRALNCRASAAVLGGADLIVTCVDQDGARLRAAHWAKAHLTPHLDIGAGVTQLASGARLLAADIRLLLPGAGCIRCVGGLADLEQAEYELHAPPGALPRRPPQAWNAGGRLGSSITLNSMAVSFGIQSFLDLLDGTLAGGIWHRLRWRPGGALEVNSGLVTAGVGCLLCRMDRPVAM